MSAATAHEQSSFSDDPSTADEYEQADEYEEKESYLENRFSVFWFWILAHMKGSWRTVQKMFAQENSLQTLQKFSAYMEGTRDADICRAGGIRDADISATSERTEDFLERN